MKLAIMQPYAFPYLGYFQLIQAADRFVLLDDVSFITAGWINRNRILGSDGVQWFTIPVSGASRNRRICDIEIADQPRWREKLSRTLWHTYSKAPYFEDVWPLIEKLLLRAQGNLADVIRASLRELTRYLGIDTPIVESSSRYDNSALRGEDRIIDICRREEAGEYLNAEGGRVLYHADRFEARGIRLRYLEHEPMPYPQFDLPFVARLSIIDVMMFNSPRELARRLGEYRLCSADFSSASSSS